MEGLIIFIIISLISMFFKGKEQKGQPQKPQAPMPPFSNQTTPPQPAPKTARQTPRSLEDFAKEVFGQLEQQAAQPSQPTMPPPLVERVQEAVPQVTASEEKVARPKMVQRPLVEQLAQENKAAFQVVPQSREALMQAVVMSEILGAPKSRRRA